MQAADERHHCLVCSAPLGAPVFESPSEQSITSLAAIRAGRTRVWWCGRCTHLQTPPLPALAQYYDDEYDLLTATEDEDQVHEMNGDRPVYRTEFQSRGVEARLADLPRDAAVLDFGAGKGRTLQHVAENRPDLEIHLFDVSDRYASFWRRFTAPQRCATHHLPEAWQGRFDLITSFFVLEHAADPAGMLRALRGLLAPHGRLHLLVPDVRHNHADFVVCDHVNHFSPESLRHVMERCGLSVIEIDDRAHTGALTALARPGLERSVWPDESAIRRSQDRIGATAAYYQGIADRVRQFEVEHAGPAAVYGAGFYGTLITAALAHEPVCYLDCNPHRQGSAHLGVPVLAPAALPPEVSTVYVGLNPVAAGPAIAAVESWRDRPLEMFFLPGLPAPSEKETASSGAG